MELSFGFGAGTQDVTVPDKNLIGVLHAGKAPAGPTGDAEVRRALASPIGAPRLRELVKPGEKIAVITSDITRPIPTWVVLPPLLDELTAAGADLKDVTVVFGLGSHRHMTEEERRHLMGDSYGRVACCDSDPDDVVEMGKTSRGTPVDVFRRVAEADRRICLGNIEYHYFAGYSGGAKAIMPGVSTREAIQCNHKMMLDPCAKAGRLDDNPVRQDIEEAGRICGIDYLLNVVLSEHKEVLRAFAGDSVQAHREGCRFLDSIYRKEIPQAADIVLVSQGGAPKDLNLYQTQKALDNAAHAVKPGGVIVLIGSCKEGLGEKTFEEWLVSAATPQELTERIRREFKLGGHKAAAIAIVLEKAEVDLVSDLAPDFVKSIFLVPRASAQEALDAAFAKLGPDATVLAMPFGGSTLPHVKE